MENQDRLNFLRAKAEMWEEDDNNIKGFFGPYRFLSNYHEAPILFENLAYKSNEAAYQAAKSSDYNVRVPFTTYGPGKSRKEGRLLEMRPGWDVDKLRVMYEVNLYKYTYHLDLRRALLATGDKYLEETNWWGDVYWGICNGIGENNLGKTLMKVREELNKHFSNDK